MAAHRVVEGRLRYSYRALPEGVSEEQPLDFYSPYGCSKGAGDQYSIDYARIYGLKTVTFRQSCIYGQHQFGMEDQGWVAWFAIRALLQKPVVIYGDGKQVRDVLYIEDLIKAYELAIKNINKTAGKVYNIGGGSRNTLSLLELVQLLNKKFGCNLKYSFADWRPGDQKIYVSNIKKAAKDFGWRPAVAPEEGVRRLMDWLVQNKKMFNGMVK
jgi:CDP-paratose 2-epimerase